MGDPDSLASILWSTDPAAQRAIWIVLGAALVTAASVHGPLLVRLSRLFQLEQQLLDLSREKKQDDAHGEDGRDRLKDAVRESPLEEPFAEFERRWSTAQLDATPERAPIRLADVLDERPLLPFGPRRSLLAVLPGLFLGLGVFAALTGLIPSLAELPADEAPREAQSLWLASQLGLALRTTAWGFLCAMAASLTGRLLEGGFDARTARLDELVEAAYGSVSPGELAEITRKTQQSSLDTLGQELTHFANELTERIDRGLRRIEQSTSHAASLVSQEQRGALHTLVQELSASVHQGVEHHVEELRSALERAVEHQDSVTNSLTETFERMADNAETQDRVARTLTESANSIEQAGRALREVDDALGSTAGRLHDTLSEGNEAIERLSVPVRAAGESTREIHLAIDRARNEVGIHAEDVARAITELTSHTRQIDRTMESLREEIHEESRRLQSSSGELGRKLTHAAEAMGLLEITTADTLGSGPAELAPHERSWSRSPSGGAPGSETRAARDEGHTETSRFDRPPRALTDDAPRTPASDIAHENDDASHATPTEREPTLSDFRLGTPRAQGPDPYQRLEHDPDSASNLRHLPSPDRELGEGLRLSGLLGPREADDRTEPEPPSSDDASSDETD